MNKYRANKRKQEIITTEAEVSYDHLMLSAPHNASVSSFTLEDISKALSCIPEIHRVPFIRYFEGYKYDEIAAEFNLPLGTVKTRIHSAREALKKQLKMHRS